MKLKVRLTKIFIILLLLVSISYSQTEQDTAKTVKSQDSVFVMQKSPWGAVARSAIIPGWGQIYNESYWKVPVFLGAFGGFLYGWNFYNNQYKDWSQIYEDSITEDNTTGDSRYKQMRDDYRDERDLFVIYLSLTYLLNLVDAYVDAHLFDFDVSENTMIQQKQMNIRFYFNR